MVKAIISTLYISESISFMFLSGFQLFHTKLRSSYLLYHPLASLMVSFAANSWSDVVLLSALLIYLNELEKHKSLFSISEWDLFLRLSIKASNKRKIKEQ